MKKNEEEKLAKRCMPIVIRRYRDAVGMSQQQLADGLGVSKGFVSALEGGRSVPNLDMLVKLAQVLRVRPAELVDAMMAEAEKASRAPRAAVNRVRPADGRGPLPTPAGTGSGLESREQCEQIKSRRP